MPQSPQVRIGSKIIQNSRTNVPENQLQPLQRYGSHLLEHGSVRIGPQIRKQGKLTNKQQISVDPYEQSKHSDAHGDDPLSQKRHGQS